MLSSPSKFSSLFKKKHQPLKRHLKLLDQVCRLSEELSSLPDPQLLHQFQNPSTPPHRLAAIREAAKRTLGLEPYPVQLLAGILLSEGHITEVATGEGKTLIGTLPACLLAAQGKTTHIATVNTYLAQRDFEWTAPLYHFLQIRAQLLPTDPNPSLKTTAYNATVLIGTGYEFGFDYLRNQTRLLQSSTHNPTTQTLLGLHEHTPPTHQFANLALIDEVDSVLLDEALTPLILSSGQDSPHPHPHIYHEFAHIAKNIAPEFYSLDKTANKIDILPHTLHALQNEIPKSITQHLTYPISHYLQNAIRAQHLITRDEHYVVDQDKIQIIDPHTGRRFKDRSWSHGLHQAVQAKERVSLTTENAPTATLSRQQYFKKYPTLSGMSGTTLEAAQELQEAYGLTTFKIPPNKPSLQNDHPPIIFQDTPTLLEHLLQEVSAIHFQGRPILIGTRNISTSEKIAQLLQHNDLPHQLLNAKQDHSEAQIIAAAGNKNAITIATNMAGRGTHIDISEEVATFGGLHVIAINFNESSRVDRQLLGRTARQGLPGTTSTLIALDSDLIQKYQPNAKSIASIQKIQHTIEQEHYQTRYLITQQDLKIEALKRTL